MDIKTTMMKIGIVLCGVLVWVLGRLSVSPTVKTVRLGDEPGYAVVHHAPEYTIEHHDAQTLTVHHDAIRYLYRCDICEIQSTSPPRCGHDDIERGIFDTARQAYGEVVVIMPAYDERVLVKSSYDEKIPLGIASDK